MTQHAPAPPRRDLSIRINSTSIQTDHRDREDIPRYRGIDAQTYCGRCGLHSPGFSEWRDSGDGQRPSQRRKPMDLLAGPAEEWNGPGGVGDYAGANGNTYEV